MKKKKRKEQQSPGDRDAIVYCTSPQIYSSAGAFNGIAHIFDFQ